MSMTRLNKQHSWEWATPGRRSLWRVGLALGLAVAGGIPVSASVADAFYVDAHGTAYAQSIGGYDNQQNTFDTGNLPQTSVTGSTSASVPSGQASSNANASASMGVLSGQVSIYSDAYSVNSQPQASANFTATSSNQITVTSANLASGTPVSILLTEQLSQTITGGLTANVAFTQSFPGISGATPIAFYNGPAYTATAYYPYLCSGTCTAQTVLQTSVGSIFMLIDQLGVSGAGGNNTSGIVQATGLTFLNVLTAGASYTTDSGVIYPIFSPVPVPPTVLLFGSGIVAFAVWWWQGQRLSKTV